MHTRHWRRRHSKKREFIDEQRVSPRHCENIDSSTIALGDGKAGGEGDGDESALRLLASFDAERTKNKNYSYNLILTEGLTGVVEGEDERSPVLKTTFVVADQPPFHADFKEGFEVEFQDDVFTADRREELRECEGPPPGSNCEDQDQTIKKGSAYHNEKNLQEVPAVQDNFIPHPRSSESTATNTSGSSPFKLLTKHNKDIESPRSKSGAFRIGSRFQIGCKLFSTIFTASHYFHLRSKSLFFASERSDPVHYQNMDQQQNLDVQQQQALSFHDNATIPNNETSPHPRQRKRTKKISLRRTTKKYASNEILGLHYLQSMVASREEPANCEEMIAIPERKLEDLPMWSAERILHFKRQEKMMDKEERGQMHCREVETSGELSTPNEGDISSTKRKTIDSVTIREDDWWDITIVEVSDGEINIDDESDGDADLYDDDYDGEEVDGSDLSSHLPLCALYSTHSSGSPQSSLNYPPDDTVESVDADFNADSATATTASATVSSSSQTREGGSTVKRTRKASKRKKRKTATIKSFRNVGLSTWNACRAEWRNYGKESDCSPDGSETHGGVQQPNDESEHNDNAEESVRNVPAATIFGKNVSDCTISNRISGSNKSGLKKSSLTSHQYKQVVKGLKGVTRQYELPKAMSLAEMIEVYLDIWEGDSF